MKISSHGISRNIVDGALRHISVGHGTAGHGPIRDRDIMFLFTAWDGILQTGLHGKIARFFLFTGWHGILQTELHGKIAPFFLFTAWHGILQTELHGKIAPFFLFTAWLGILQTELHGSFTEK